MKPAIYMIKYATLCAVAVASVTGCGAGVSRDAAPTGQSVAPLVTGESVSPCSSATADVLKSAAQRQYEAFSDPFTFRKVRCSGDWAFALISMKGPPETNPPSMVLFHIPPSIAAELEC